MPVLYLVAQLFVCSPYMDAASPLLPPWIKQMTLFLQKTMLRKAVAQKLCILAIMLRHNNCNNCTAKVSLQQKQCNSCTAQSVARLCCTGKGSNYMSQRTKGRPRKEKHVFFRALPELAKPRDFDLVKKGQKIQAWVNPPPPPFSGNARKKTCFLLQGLP